MLRFKSGRSFNRAVDCINSPTSLQHLILEIEFSQPIDGVTWPTSPQHLTFEYALNQPIENVTCRRVSNISSSGAASTSQSKALPGRRRFNKQSSGGTSAFTEKILWSTSLPRRKNTARIWQSSEKLGKAMPSLERFIVRLSSNPISYGILRDVEWRSRAQTLCRWHRCSPRGGVYPPECVTFEYRPCCLVRKLRSRDHHYFFQRCITEPLQRCIWQERMRPTATLHSRGDHSKVQGGARSQIV